MTAHDNGAYVKPEFVPIPYWVQVNGDAFEQAWATDRRDALAEILIDVWRTAWLAGHEDGANAR